MASKTFLAMGVLLVVLLAFSSEVAARAMEKTETTSESSDKYGHGGHDEHGGHYDHEGHYDHDGHGGHGDNGCHGDHCGHGR